MIPASGMPKERIVPERIARKARGDAGDAFAGEHQSEHHEDPLRPGQFDVGELRAEERGSGEIACRPVEVEAITLNSAVGNAGAAREAQFHRAAQLLRTSPNA